MTNRRIKKKRSPYKAPCQFRLSCPVACGWCKTHQPDDLCVRLAKGSVEKWKRDVYPPNQARDFEKWDKIISDIEKAAHSTREADPF